MKPVCIKQPNTGTVLCVQTSAFACGGHRNHLGKISSGSLKLSLLSETQGGESLKDVFLIPHIHFSVYSLNTDSWKGLQFLTHMPNAVLVPRTLLGTEIIKTNPCP